MFPEAAYSIVMTSRSDPTLPDAPERKTLMHDCWMTAMRLEQDVFPAFDIGQPSLSWSGWHRPAITAIDGMRAPLDLPQVGD